MWQRALSGSGGGGSETLLWHNGSSTSAFANQTVTLTGGVLSDFSELKIVYRLTKTDTSLEHYIKFDISSFAGASEDNRMVLGGQTGSTSMARMVIYASNTSISFGSALGIYSASSNNDYIIPLDIYGIK